MNGRRTLSGPFAAATQAQSLNHLEEDFASFLSRARIVSDPLPRAKRSAASSQSESRSKRRRKKVRAELPPFEPIVYNLEGLAEKFGEAANEVRRSLLMQVPSCR